MSPLNLTEKEKKQLVTIHKYTYNNSMRENRIRVVLLCDKNMNREEIKEILLLDLQTIRKYINAFQLHRMDSIDFEDGRKTKSGNKKEISSKEEEQVKRYIQDNLISEAKEVQKYIKDKFKIDYKISTVIKLMHDLGFVYKKVVSIPQKGNTSKVAYKQLEFEEKYKKLKEEIKQEDEILFLDAVHPSHNTKVGFAWIGKGEEKIIETNSGRDRVNINGAYNILDAEVIVTSSDTVNTQSTLELFDTLIKNYGHNSGNLYCISDNATYYKSRILQEALKTEKYSRIKMIFIPAYSPNLNPIERVWKFFKKEVMENKFYKTFTKFKDVIDNFFKKDLKLPMMKERLRKFASDNFHIRNRRTLHYTLIPDKSFQFNYFGR
jgi:transposase